MMVAFELQTYQGGVWKIDSLYDDRKLAMMEAQRVSKGDRYAAVRLVEENYDPDTQSSTSKIIFRSSRLQNENDAALERKRQVSHEIETEGRAIRQAASQRQYQEFHQNRERQTTRWLAGMVLKSGAILLLGIGLLYGLKLFAERF